MSKRIFLATGLLAFLCFSYLSAQSLAEAARKEKERRAKLEKKASKVVTNQDLKTIKRLPAVSLPEKEDQIADAEGPKTEPESIVPPKTERIPSTQDIDKKTGSASDSTLEQKYEKAREYVDLLTIKMNGLWQKYYSADDGTPKERIQSEISQTYLQLQKAQHDAEKAKKEWEASGQKTSNDSQRNG